MFRANYPGPPEANTIGSTDLTELSVLNMVCSNILGLLLCTEMYTDMGVKSLVRFNINFI